MFQLWNKQMLQNYTLSLFMQWWWKLPFKVLIRRHLGFSNLFKVALKLNQSDGEIESELYHWVCLSCQSPVSLLRMYRMYFLLKWPPLMLMSFGWMITKTRIVLQEGKLFVNFGGKAVSFVQRLTCAWHENKTNQIKSYTCFWWWGSQRTWRKATALMPKTINPELLLFCGYKGFWCTETWQPPFIIITVCNYTAFSCVFVCVCVCVCFKSCSPQTGALVPSSGENMSLLWHSFD